MTGKLYWIIYIMMVGSFFTLSMSTMPTWKDKAIGLLLTIVNGLLFWK